LRQNLRRLLEHAFYPFDEWLIHQLIVQPENVDPIVDVFEFACFGMIRHANRSRINTENVLILVLIFSARMGTEKKVVFLRPSTGLVRQIGVLDSIALGTGYAGIGLLAFYISSGYWLFPSGDFNLAVFLTVFFAAFIMLSYAFLSAVMPRTGGDWVFISRVIRPDLGFMFSFNEVFWGAFWVGWNGFFFATFGLPLFFGVIGISTGNSSLLSIASTLSAAPSNHLAAIAIGSVLILLWATLQILPTKVFTSTQKFGFFVVMASTIASIVILAFVSHSDFVSRFNQIASPYLGSNAYQQVVNNATSAGVGNTPSYNSGATLALLPIIFGGVAWTFMPSFMAGEIKQVKKTSLLTFPIGIAILGAVLILWNVTMLKDANYKFMVGVNTMYNTGSLPLPVPPFAYFFASLFTNNIVLILLLAIGFCGSNFLALPNNTMQANRQMFAWSFDRIVPKAFGSVHERFRTPWISVITLSLGGLGWLVFYTLSGTTTTYTGILGLALSQVPACLAAAILPFRKKAIFESSSVKWKLGRIPVMTLIGTIGFVFVLIIELEQIVNPAYGANSFVSLSALVITLIVGFVFFYLAKYYRKRQGVNLDYICSEIPPD
jgi:APA family basic amino acid/polyamine antiporter